MRADVRPRPLGGADLAQLVALERAAQPRPWSPAQLGAALAEASRRVVGVEVDGALVGHAVVARLPFEAELESILVAPGRRRQGIATRLLAAVIEQAGAWGSERLLLEVRTGNAEAIALYRRAGFIEDGRRRGYYPPPIAGTEREDALLMSLSLGGG